MVDVLWRAPVSLSWLMIHSLMENAMATHSSILAWRVPWPEEPGELQSTGSQRVRHDLVTKHSTFNMNVLKTL